MCNGQVTFIFNNLISNNISWNGFRLQHCQMLTHLNLSFTSELYHRALWILKFLVKLKPHTSSKKGWPKRVLSNSWDLSWTGNRCLILNLSFTGILNFSNDEEQKVQYLRMLIFQSRNSYSTGFIIGSKIPLVVTHPPEVNRNRSSWSVNFLQTMSK